MGLMPQDAYYYLYGQNLSLSYFDHPGMIAYILRFFSSLFGSSVFVIKLADFTITSITIVCFYWLAALFLPKNRLQRSMILLVSTLFITILCFNSTPDVPLILFWTLSIHCLFKAIFEQKKQYWILGGICMGLAFNSKYSALLLQVGIFLFLIFSNQYRSLFASRWLWIGLIVCMAVTTPVWWWNYQNDFASFAFQSTKRIGSIDQFTIKPLLFLGAVGHQLLLLLPVLFGVFITIIFKHFKKVLTKFKLPSQKTLFLLCFFVPTFIGFTLIAPIYWVKLNWMIPSYITGIIIAGMYITEKLIRTQVILSIIFHLVIACQIIFYLVPIKSDDTWVGWEELSDEVEALQKQYPNTFVFSADDYKTTAVLNFYLPIKVYGKNIIGLPAKQFDYLGDDLSKLTTRNALFIDSDKRTKNINKRNKILPVELNDYFKNITELNPIVIKKGTRKIRKFWVYYCEDYYFR